MIKYVPMHADNHLVVSRSCTCTRLLCIMTTYVKNHSERGRFNPWTLNTVTHRHECRWLYFIRMEKNKKYFKYPSYSHKIHHRRTKKCSPHSLITSIVSLDDCVNNPGFSATFTCINFSIYVQYIHMENEGFWMGKTFEHRRTRWLYPSCLEASFGLSKSCLSHSEGRGVLLWKFHIFPAYLLNHLSYNIDIGRIWSLNGSWYFCQIGFDLYSFPCPCFEDLKKIW